MKVEIWSDVFCLFCYIGKRKFEEALARFAHQDAVEVVWHSFQLNPDVTRAARANPTLTNDALFAPLEARAAPLGDELTWWAKARATARAATE